MTAANNPWSQDGYRCRLEWGRRGVRVAAQRNDVLVVVVGMLSFSTATITAVAHGGVIIPCAMSDDAPALAARVHARLAAS